MPRKQPSKSKPATLAPPSVPSPAPLRLGDRSAAAMAAADHIRLATENLEFVEGDTKNLLISDRCGRSTELLTKAYRKLEQTIELIFYEEHFAQTEV